MTESALMKSLPGTYTPCSFTPPLDLTIEQAVVIAHRLALAHNFTPWALGDLLLFARNHLGEEYAQILEAYPGQEAYCYRCMRVAEAYAPNQRHERLSMLHHHKIMKMDHPTREAWLTLAEHHEWSARTLQSEVQNAHLQALNQGQEADLPSPPPGADHLLAHAEEALANLTDWVESEIVEYPNKGTYRITLRVELEKIQPVKATLLGDPANE